MDLIWLIFAHYIGDIALQSEWQAKQKGQYWYILMAHCIIWAACVSVALEYIGIFETWKALFLIVGHGVMDKWKSSKPKTPETWNYIYYDQAFHMIQILVVYLL